MTEIIEQVFIDGETDRLDEYLSNLRNTAVIDWRADDNEIVWDFGRFVDEGDELTSESTDDGLTITYHGVAHAVPLPATPHQYETIRAVIHVLAPKYGARLVRDSYYSDTHVFLVRHSGWWDALDRDHPERAAELFQPVTPELDFP